MTIRLKGLTVLIFFAIIFCGYTIAQNTLTKEILWTTDWSPNGKFIAIGGNINALNIYSAKNLKLYKSLPLKNTITRVKWHPSINLIAVTTQLSGDKSCIINFDTSEKIELEGVSPDGARGVDWNHTGDYLAIADNDGQILIYNIKGELVRKFNHENTKSITAIDWHPSKNILTTVADKIRFYDMEGNLLKSIKHRPEEVLLLSIAWHKSGDFFVTGDYGDEKDRSLLQYWNQHGDCLKSIDISKVEYRNLAWNPTGNRLATASDALRIWDTTGNLISEGNSEDYLWGVSWNKNGKRLVTSSKKQIVTIWDNKARKIMSDE